ncbi:meckelin-like [Daphnia pulex]|uniref:meckelin-like n=1 Tax=Daphnia pulex TaxID=6669 RepID=UPI001EE0F90D|nr:meckelin-like [Daphnia pulex]
MIVLVAHYLLFFILKKVEAYDVILSSFPESCNRSSYFDSISHKCKGCGVFQISSDDRLSCECGFGYYPEFNEKSKAIECLRCNQSIQSEMCLKSNLTCEPYDIKVLQITGNITSARCLKCPLWHQPDDTKSSCVPCSNMCHCPSEYEDVNGTCVKDLFTIPETPTIFTYNLHGRPYISNYLRNWVRLTAIKCKAHGGGKYCEHLINLCVLTDYNYDSQSACSLYRQLSGGFSNSIYYDDSQNEYLLNSARINILKDQKMDFMVKQYALDGTYLLIQPLQSVFKSLCCTGTWKPIQRNANIYHSCSVYSKVFNMADMRFYEIYFVDRAINQSRLINVPIKILNLVRGGVQRNREDKDISRWQLTKRFFNFDSATGSNQEGNTDFVRYLSSLTIRISVMSGEKSLALRLPYATINYESIGSLENGNSPVIHFAVKNTVSMDEAMKSLEIALSVLSTFGALYALIRIVVWYIRSDKATIDLQTLIRLLVYGADILANVILIVIFFITFYWFMTFRQQEEVTVSLPARQEEQFIKDLVISAFTLKTISVLWMIGEQCNVDIFLIDWESPRPTKGEIVSVWRMFFVANEWNELQVARKSSISIQVILVLSTLKVFQFERFSLEIPATYFMADTFLNYNTVLRLALGLSTYLFFSLAQNILNAALFERYVEHKIQRFTDVCTLSNISVWLRIHSRYGFYIHGRSPHGFADIDMQTMCQQLQREEENLCAQRGLVQGQDTQTFSIFFHETLSDKWRKLIKNQSSGTSTLFFKLNEFFTSFLDHAFRELDYEVRDRHFLETVLDIEMWWNMSQNERSIFYNDGRNCFDSVLFYGNEVTLVSFEMLLFSLVDVYCHSYLTAALTVFIVFKALQFVRYRFGRRNLAKKTMIDSRFLF